MTIQDRRRIEFGDFQTPDDLAVQVVGLLDQRGIIPSSVVEPTCGVGSFIAAAMRQFPKLKQIVGVEVNPAYLQAAHAQLGTETGYATLELRNDNFFDFDWSALIHQLPPPVLILGNPPWVTSSRLGSLKGSNLPKKSNFKREPGLDAITGKANFDIAEWIVIQLLHAAEGASASIAMLVKTSVARRILLHAWRTGIPIGDAAIYSIDALKHFGAGASACLFHCNVNGSPGSTECDLYDLDAPALRLGKIGYHDNRLIANIEAYRRAEHLIATAPVGKYLQWRSGVKHDCSAVMELQRVDPDRFVNRFGEVLHLEPEFLYPLMKGADVASQRGAAGNRWMLVPQRSTGDDTAAIAQLAPRTWEYLQRHRALFEQRGSSIYRNRPPFSVFGVGSYTFMPWKVAICSLYKRIEFAVVGPLDQKPVVFDDTVYHLSFQSEREARIVKALLDSDFAMDFFHAMVFWDAKRPITIDVLGHLDLHALAKACGLGLPGSRGQLSFI